MRTESYSQPPGTVSQILWHFTGGPLWNAKQARQHRQPKPAHRAYANLVSILRTRELRLGSYREVVRVRASQTGRYNAISRSFQLQRSPLATFSSVPICCLADVPLIHLSYLASRYGKFAIGFHRREVVAHGFNPVFYTLEDGHGIQSIYEGFTELNRIDPSTIDDSVTRARASIATFVSRRRLDDEPDTFAAFLDLEADATSIADYVQNANAAFVQFLGFVKTFTSNEFGSIYCEREWRALEPFTFNLGAVAMIIVPRRDRGREYFPHFAAKVADGLGLPRSVPVVPWEDLMEH